MLPVRSRISSMRPTAVIVSPARTGSKYSQSLPPSSRRVNGTSKGTTGRTSRIARRKVGGATTPAGLWRAGGVCRIVVANCLRKSGYVSPLNLQRRGFTLYPDDLGSHFIRQCKGVRRQLTVLLTTRRLRANPRRSPAANGVKLCYGHRPVSRKPTPHARVIRLSPIPAVIPAPQTVIPAPQPSFPRKRESSDQNQ